MLMNMTYEDAMYMMAASETMTEKLVKAIKKYWKENGEMICAGLCSMSGSNYIPSYRR